MPKNRTINNRTPLPGNPVWQLPLSAELLCSQWPLGSWPCFFETITVLRVPIGDVIGVYRLESTLPNKWLLFWYNHGLGANKSELGPKHGKSPWAWTIMVDNSRLIHATGDRWQCDQSESKAVKAKDGRPGSWCRFYEENWFSSETFCGQNKPQ